MAKQKQNKFIRWFKPLMDVMSELGTASSKEVIDKIAEKECLSEDYMSQVYPKSGGNVFRTQVWFARQYLTWEGLMYTPERSVWSLTDKGAKIAPEFTEQTAVEIVKKWVAINSKLRKEKQHSEENANISTDNEEVEAEDVIPASLLDIIKSTSPEGFERLCGELLRRYNFENVEVTQRSRDGGIDGFATLKINPFVNYRVAFQCKRYKDTVSVDEIRAFCYHLSKYDRILFITTGKYSKDARQIEKEQTSLELIDGEQLVKMFEDIGLGVTPVVHYEPNLSYFERFM